MSDEVLYQAAEKGEGVGIITLNQPEARNAMNPLMLDAFSQAVDRAQADPNLRALVLTGKGSCFSAGANLRGTIQREELGVHRLPHEGSYRMYTPFMRLLDVEVPVVGALNGHAVGGGFGLALLCDLRVGAKDAKYGVNFTKIGLHPGLGLTYTLPRLVGHAKAAELFYTGLLVKGEEAERIGILNRAVNQEEVLDEALDFAREIAGSAPLAVRLTKLTLTEAFRAEVRRLAYAEAYAQAATVDTDDFREGVAALLEKRKPEFQGK